MDCLPKIKDRKRTLLVSLQGLGNTILLEPVVRYLLEKKGIAISLALSNNGSYQFLSAIHDHANIEFYVWNESRGAVTNIVTLVKKLRRQKFDIIFTTHPSGKRENLLSFLLRAEEKRSLKRPEGFFKLFQFLNLRAKLADKHRHDLQNNAELFNVPFPRVRRKLDIAKTNKIIIAVHAGSKSKSKRWVIDNYKALLKKCSETFNCEFILFGGSDEINLINHLQDEKYQTEVVVGRSFPELLRGISKCHLFIGNDSSLMHIASLSGLPVMAIWAYTDFVRTSPYGEGNVVVKKDYACVPCYDLTKKYVEDCKYHLRCIKDIGVEEVYTVMMKWVDVLKRNKLPLEHDFLDLDCVARTERLSSGCVVVSLKETL